MTSLRNANLSSADFTNVELSETIVVDSTGKDCSASKQLLNEKGAVVSLSEEPPQYQMQTSRDQLGGRDIQGVSTDCQPQKDSIYPEFWDALQYRVHERDDYESSLGQIQTSQTQPESKGAHDGTSTDYQLQRDNSYPKRWEDLRNQVYNRDKYECQNCKISGRNNGDVQLDAHHIVPTSKNGNHVMSNLVTLCRACHSSVHSQASSRNTYPDNWDDLRKQVYSHDNYECQNCGIRGGNDGDIELHAHHIVPTSKNGNHVMSNLVTLCRACHSSVHPHMSSN
jgi:5-methylcytosine-specific restriction endonuclease McrA